MDSAQHLRLYNILIGSMKTQSIHVAAELGLADVLARGAADIDTLARAVDADSAALFRLLRALCSLGLISERDGIYKLTAMGHVLRDDVPGSLKPFALLLGGAPWWRAWGALAHAVRRGEGAFDATHGIGYFDFLAAHPDEARKFRAFMASIAGMNAGAIVPAYPFGRFRTVVDVGGGGGHLLAAILAAAPAARGVLFDLPGAEPESLPEAVAGRIEVVAGDFFRAVPGGGDLYLLQQVLHDWSDDDARRILVNVRAGMPPGATLLVIDAVIEPGNQPSFNKFTDLHMMVLSQGGRERTAAEFDALFRSAGLRLARILPTSTAFALMEGFAAE
jgi:hypothetical protein